LLEVSFNTFASIGTSAAWTSWVDYSLGLENFDTWAEVRDGAFGFYLGWEAGNHYVAKVEFRITYTEGGGGATFQPRPPGAISNHFVY